MFLQEQQKWTFSGELLKPLGRRFLLLLLHEGSEKETEAERTQKGQEAKKGEFWTRIKPLVLILFIVFIL